MATKVDPLTFNHELFPMQSQEILRLASTYPGSNHLDRKGLVTLGLAYDSIGVNAQRDEEFLGKVKEAGISPITVHYAGLPHSKLSIPDV